MNGNNEAKALTTQNWIAVVGTSAVLIGGFWVLITSQMESRVAPLVEKVRELESLQEKYDKLLADVAADHAERKAGEVEVESQFRALDASRNIQFSDQQRVNAMIWDSTPLGEVSKYPSAPFFQPELSRNPQMK